MAAFWQHHNLLLSSGQPFVAVTLVDVVESAPASPGARMLVTRQGLEFGTIGGGTLEMMALDQARAMLAEGGPPATQPRGMPNTRFVHWNLRQDVGMTCGGAVRLFFEAFNLYQWTIAIFGAGHCCQALVRLLLTLQCQVTVIDPRPEWLAKLPAPEDGRLHIVHAQGPMESHVKNLPAGAFVVVMTTGHVSDQPILIELLKTRPGDFPYVGVIGSAAKATALHREVLAAGIPEHVAGTYHCPIGLPFGSNDPAEIALSVAAQLLERRDATT